MTEHKDFDKKKINDGELQKYSGSYSEEGLLHKISRYGAHIGIELLYKVVQLWCVLQKPEVPAKEKALIMGFGVFNRSPGFCAGYYAGVGIQ